jgi:hypothetical protein
MDSPRDPLAAFLIGRCWLALRRTRPDSTDFSPSMSGYRDRLALPRQGMTLYSPVGLLRPAPELNQKENADEDENQC